MSCFKYCFCNGGVEDDIACFRPVRDETEAFYSNSGGEREVDHCPDREVERSSNVWQILIPVFRSPCCETNRHNKDNFKRSQIVFPILEVIP